MSGLELGESGMRHAMTGFKCYASVFLLLVVSVGGCHQISGPSRDGDATTRPVAGEDAASAVNKELCGAPKWATIGSGNQASRDLLLKSLLKVSTYTVDDIRAGIILYISRSDSVDYAEAFARRSNIYVLNRLLFDVPDHGRPVAVFGAWVGVENAPMWPLAKRSSTIVLTGYPGSYRGPPYDAIAEFDCFRKAYRIRDIDTIR
jgi:hypothetical protein